MVWRHASLDRESGESKQLAIIYQHLDYFLHLFHHAGQNTIRARPHRGHRPLCLVAAGDELGQQPHQNQDVHLRP